MNKRVLTGLLLIGCTAVQAAGDWTPLLAWVGKYPSDRIAQHSGNLLSQLVIRNELKKLLPEAEISALARYDVETPIKKHGEYLVVNKCMPHNCPAEMAMIVVDVKSQMMWAGFFSRAGSVVSTRWYGSANDYSTLPDEIKNEFLALHGD